MLTRLRLQGFKSWRDTGDIALNAAVLLGIAAIVVTLGIGTCSTNGRIDDGSTSVNRRIDDTNRRIDDTATSVNQRIDEVQSDVGEIRTMLFEILKNLNPAD